MGEWHPMTKQTVVYLLLHVKVQMLGLTQLMVLVGKDVDAVS